MVLTQSCNETEGLGMVLLLLRRLFCSPWSVTTIRRPTPWLCPCILANTLHHFAII